MRELQLISPDMSAISAFLGIVDKSCASEPHRSAVAARVCRAFENAALMAHDGARVAHCARIWPEHFDIMSGAAQRLDHCGLEATFELQRHAVFAPRLAEQPTRRGDGGLQSLAEHGVAREQGRLRLRL